MTTAEKIARSSDKTIFTLHREGIFFKCYNEDANVFLKKVREYEVSSKYVKNVGATVSSLGFSVSLVSKGNLTLDMMCGLLGAEKYDYGKVRVVVCSGPGITRLPFFAEASEGRRVWDYSLPSFAEASEGRARDP